MEDIKQQIFLDPPGEISHSFEGLGNIINLKWDHVNTAYGYVIEKYIQSEETYVPIGVSRGNTFLDYSNLNFSTDEATIAVRYRIGTLGGEFENYDRTSDVYYVTIPKLDNFYLNLVEREEANSNTAAVDGYKEEKLIIEEDNSLQLYKLSTLSPNIESNFTELNLITSVYGNIKESYSVNDNLGFYLQFTNNTIVKFDQNNLFPIFTLPTLNKSINNVKIGAMDNLICCLETTFDETQITLYDVTDNVVRTNLSPIILLDEFDNRIDIVEYEIIGEDKIFVLDRFGSLRIFEVDFISRLVTEIVAYQPILGEGFDRSILQRKMMLLRSEIVEVLKLSKTLTDEEKEIVEGAVLADNDVINDLIDRVTFDYAESINLDTSQSNQGIIMDEYCAGIFTSVKTNGNTRNIAIADLEAFETEFNNSIRYDIWKKSVYFNGPKFLEIHEDILDNTHMVHSNLSNHVVIWSPYFIHFIDIASYKFHNVIDNITPKNKLINYLMEDFYPDSDIGNNDEFDVLKTMEIDKFVKNVVLDKGFRSLAVEFEEIISMPIYNPGSNSIAINSTFSNRYIDIYKLDPNDVFGKEVTEVESGAFDFAHLKGFGYPLIYNYPSPGNSILKETYYFYEGDCYFTTKEKLFYDRTEASVREQLLADIADGTLEYKQGQLYDIIHFNTRVNLTSNKETYDSTRHFSMFGDENDFDVVDGSSLVDQGLAFLDGKTMFTSNVYEKLDIGMNFDRFGESCLITSYGEEPDNNGRNTMACVHVGQEFFPYSETILLPTILFTKQSYPGTFSRRIIPCDDKFMYLRGYQNELGESYVLYYSPLYEDFTFLSINNIRKLELTSLDQFYNIISAVFIERSELDMDADPALKLYNDQRLNEDLSLDFYAREGSSVWRWQVDYSVLLENDYLAFRVSVNNEPWQYLPKTARSFESNITTGDGSYVFNIQYQYRDGSWSRSLNANYHLKTSPPNKPILLDMQTDSSDRGKPILTWDRSPDHYRYEIIYNDSIFYSTFDNFHAPEESFTNYTSNIVNIPIKVRAIDLHGNVSPYSEWAFVVSSYTKEDLDVTYERYTNNVNPLISWSPKSGEFINHYEYKFDNFNVVETEDLSCRHDAGLADGIHTFEITGFDSLGNSTNTIIKYFEIKTIIDGIPELLQESIDRTLNCVKDQLWLNLNYEDATNSFIYSFDNFQTFYSFDNYTLDLRDSDLEEGYHTIYIKTLDRFGNTSDALEYTFRIVETDDTAPIFDQIDSITSNQRPTWSWKVMSDHQFTNGSLSYEGSVIDSFESRTISSYQPKTNLGDGEYKLFIHSMDNYGRTSSNSAYSITIDSTIPVQPTISKASIIDTNCLFNFNKSSDLKIFGALIEFNEKDSTKFYHESLDGNFLFNNLKENTNYILEVFNISQNSKKSKPTYYSFSTNQKQADVVKVIVLPNGATINYNMSNGTYSLTKFGSYSNDSVSINNQNFELDEITIDSTVDSLSYKVLSNDVIRLQNSIYDN